MKNAIKTLVKYLPKFLFYGIISLGSNAGVSEWQTRQTQNLLWATTCGFKSRCRHLSRMSETLKSRVLAFFIFENLITFGYSIKMVQKGTSMKEKRDSSLDVVRIFAVLSVISVHYFLNSGFYNNIVAGKRMFVMVTVRGFFMVCVPLFIMLTGYLMSKKELSPKYYCGIVKTLATYVLASIACIIFKNLYMGGAYGVKESILGILDFSAANYSWYVEMYIGLFLIIPFLNLSYNGLKNQKQKQVLICTLLLLTSIPAVTNIFNFYVDSWWIHPTLSDTYQKILPSYWKALYPITIYFIGAYLKEYGLRLNRKICMLSLIGLTILSGIFNYYRSYNSVFIWGPWTDYNSIFVILMAVLVFYIIVKAEKWNNLPHFARKILRHLSEWTLGAYLLSYIFDAILYPRLSSTVSEFSYMFEYFFVCVPVVFVCSMLGAWMLNFIYKFIYTLFKKSIAK